MSYLKRLVHEVHRRSIWQVLGIYLGGSWLALQVVQYVTDHVALPGWVPAFALVLLVIGLPVVLATAVVQEGLPGSGQRARRADDAAAAGEAGEERAARADASPRTSDGPTGSGGESGQGDPGRPSASAPEASPEPAGARRLLTWRNALLGGGTAFALLGMATAGFFVSRATGVGPAATLVAKGVIEERDPIILADFRNLTADSLMGDVVGEALRIDLGQSSVVSLADESYLRDVLRRMERPPDTTLTLPLATEIAQREGLKAVLAGEIGTLGGGYVLTAHLNAATDGRVLAAFRESARDSTKLIDAVDALSRDIREKVGESLRSVQAAPRLADVTTSSLTALRKYSRAVRAIDVDGQIELGMGLLREAVAADSDFAMAWRKIGVTAPRQDDRVAALHRAYLLRDRLTEPERLLTEAAYWSEVANDDDRAIRTYEQLLDAHPDNIYGLNNLGELYAGRRRYGDAARLYARALGVQEYPWLYMRLARVRFEAGEDAAADSALRAGQAAFPSAPDLRWELPFLMAVDRGEWEALDSIGGAWVEGVAGAGWRLEGEAHAMVAMSELARGRIAEGSADLRRAIRQVERVFPAAAIFPRIMQVHVVATLEGDTARARSLLSRAEADAPVDSLPPSQRPYGPFAEAEARIGSVARARRWLERWKREVPAELRPDYEHTQRDVEVVAALREGKPRRTLELLADAEPSDGDQGMRRLRAARAYEALGMPDSAALAYAEAVRTRELQPKPDLADVLERLGDLEVQLGRPAEAAKYYGRFLELWRDADPELEPRVARVRGRLDSLRKAPAASR